MIQRSAQDLRSQGFHHNPLDKSLLPSSVFSSRGMEFIKTRNGAEKQWNTSACGKKNKIKETSVPTVELPVDEMINKGEVPRTNTSHTRSFTVQSAALVFSLLWSAWHRCALGIYGRLVGNSIQPFSGPRGSTLIASYWVWATCWCLKPRLNFLQARSGCNL